MKHTPLPWKVSGIRQSGTKYLPLPVEPVNTIEVFAPNGSGVYNSIASFTFTSRNRKEQIANAEYIVEACNNYTELLSAARLTLSFLNQTAARDRTHYSELTDIITKIDKEKPNEEFGN